MTEPAGAVVFQRQRRQSCAPASPQRLARIL